MSIRRCLPWLAAVALSAAPILARAECSPGCLDGIMTRYLTALVTHAPTGLPVATHIEVRENTQPIKLGEGAAWHDVTAILATQRFIDVQTHNVVSRSAVKLPDGKTGSLSVRLKIDGNRITESDTSFNHGTGPFDAETLIEPDILWEATVPTERRSSREQLIHIVDQYFEAISTHGATPVPWSRRCDRYESGKKMTNDPTNLSNESGNVTCEGSLLHLTGQEVIERRFPLVNAELGVVLAYGFILHRERNPPGATGLAEMFKIVDGKIRAIENIETVVPYPPDGGFGSVPPKQ